MGGTLTGPEIVKAKGVITDVKKLTLKDGRKGTLLPIYPKDLERLPNSLVDYLFHQFNNEIERGQTYPHYHQLSKIEFIDGWFAAFYALFLQGDHYNSIDDLDPESDWDDLWLGSYYIKPNYIGRSSHVCNAGFLVNPKKRGLGIGKTLGKTYLEWAPVLGYTYSVFNLVFVTNPASLKIWDSLGFDRIGKVPGVGILKGYSEPVDAIQFGKSLV